MLGRGHGDLQAGPMRFIWPVQGTVSRGWAYKSSIYVGGQHAAVDIPANTSTSIKAVADGIVKGVGWDMYSGFFVAVNHGGWQSVYRHMFDNPPVSVGQAITQGQILGGVGSTGYSTGPHLHFDLWSKTPIDGAFQKHDIWAVDPELYLGQEDDMTDEQFKALIERMDGHATFTQNLIRAEADRIIVKMDGHHAFTQGLIKEVGVDVNAIPAGGGSGATPEEVKQAVKDANREGTG